MQKVVANSGPAGAGKVTLKEVAEAAGVAESTVSRALSGKAISAVTRARIAAVAQRLGYSQRRRATAPGAPQGAERNGVVGVVVAALHNAFYPTLLDKLHDELDALGYDMILIIDDLGNATARRKLASLVDTALDGVIFTTAAIGSPAVDVLVDRGIPTVLAIRSNQRGNVDVVESDNRMAGAEAAQHLVELGHRRIAFLMGPRDTSTATDRFLGGTSVLAARGIGVAEEHVIWGNYTHEAGYSGAVRLLGMDAPPTAIVCGNDVVAIGVLDACQKLSVAVPDRLSVIGFDDIPMASWAMISLTTMRQSIAEIGAMAARQIAARIEGTGDGAPRHSILPTSLVRRRTTGILRSGAR